MSSTLTISNLSTYTSDLAAATEIGSGYAVNNNDDENISFILSYNFRFGPNVYNTVYISTNGIISFNSLSVNSGFNETTVRNNVLGVYFWSDIYNNMYYKQDTVNRIFTVVYDRYYYNTSSLSFDFSIKLYLDGHLRYGEIEINTGTISDKSVDTGIGLSFRTATTTYNDFNISNGTTTYTYPTAPRKILNNNQSQLSNKKFIFTTANLISPTIDPLNIGNKTFGIAPFTITQPSSNSVGGFSYSSSNTSIASIINTNQLQINSIGTVTITATQAASGNYTAGSTSQQITVSAAVPSIGALSIGNRTFGIAPFTITQPTSNSSGGFSYSSSNTLVATISGTTITIVGVGTSTITATQAASGNYTLGTTTATFTVAESTQNTPTNLSNPTDFASFLNSTAEYGNLQSNIIIITNITPSSKKVIFCNTNNIFKISR